MTTTFHCERLAMLKHRDHSLLAPASRPVPDPINPYGKLSENSSQEWRSKAAESSGRQVGGVRQRPQVARRLKTILNPTRQSTVEPAAAEQRCCPLSAT